MGKIIFSISLDKELFRKLEGQRGLVARSVYVEFLLNKLLTKEHEDGAGRSQELLEENH